MQIHFFVWASIWLAQLSPSLPPSIPYAWTTAVDSTQFLERRIPTPVGYERLAVAENSFAHWLRFLPLKPGRPSVRLYNGQLKSNQSAHHALINIDVGKRDLQQCADAVMRLKAEYDYAAQAYDRIKFRFTSGDEAAYTRWQAGYRPRINGNTVNWVKTHAPSSSHASFRSYMDIVFSYAGTYSLARDLPARSDNAPIQAGEIFIKGGFPGHAVIVIDVAVDSSSGERLFLLAQSYMPAQEMHILRNPNDPQLSPWYRSRPGPLTTPEWRFPAHSRKYFPDLLDQ
ncbi:MAG: DUF4846 domain-containing protein [Bacteroidota bacterium]